jgi:hypothetical protein
MNRHVRWLREQLLLWVAQGIVSPAQANRIRSLYPEPKAGAPWGTIIFAGLGAVVFGLGVILLFAYNWQAIPKAGKLAVIFLAILAAHGAGQWLLAKPGWQRPVGEALAVLGTMLYGAGIWLVAQIYHIQEHYPNGFLFWALGALALAWAMPSVAQGILAVVLLCIWGCSEAWGFDRAMHAAPLLLLVAGGGLAWWLRSVLLLVLVLAGFTLALLAAAGSLTGDLVLPVWLCVAAGFIAVGKLSRCGSWFPGSSAVRRPVAVKLKLHNASTDDLAIVDLPGNRSWALVSDEQWGEENWRWVGTTDPRPSPQAANVTLLKPCQTHTNRIAFSDPTWFVRDRPRGEENSPEVVKSLSDLDEDFSARFRFEYRPPDRATCVGLPHADLIWHGQLTTRAFTTAGAVD